MDAAALLSSARHRVGMTQTELARRAGVTQSVISDYERGRRDPSFSTLRRLIAATGLSLETQLVASTSTSALTRVRNQASELRRQLTPLGALDIRIFGSVARGDENESSDVDLLVELAPETGAFNLLRMQHLAEKLLGRPVDIVPADGLKPSVAEQVAREAVAL